MINRTVTYQVRFTSKVRQLVLSCIGINVDVSLINRNSIDHLPFENTYMVRNNLITSFAAYAAPWPETILPLRYWHASDTFNVPTSYQ